VVIKLFMIKLIIFFQIAFLFLSCSDNTNRDIDDNNLKEEIANAQITKFSDFYFVANYNGNPAVYRYDYSLDKYKVFWQLNDERVIHLLVSPDNKSGYFITKRKQRLKSSQPAIEKGRLYRIDFEIKKVEAISQLEDGIQVIPFWTDNNRFTLIINSIDKTIASYINKNTQVYNRFGKLISDNTEIFDLTKDGYPVTQFPPLNFKSPNNLFTVIERNDSLFIRQQQSKYEIKTNIISKKLLKLDWAENNKHLVILFKSKETEEHISKERDKVFMVIYDLQSKRIAKKFESLSNNSFVLIGDFLIFDKGFGKDSHIEIFMLDSFINNKTIKINGGCGLNNI